MTGRDALRQHSARLARWMGLLFAGLAVLLLLERFGWLATATGGAFPAQRLALAAAAAVPDGLYLAALWWIRQALAEMAAGRLFATVVSQALRRVGLLMLSSAVLSVLLLPSVQAALGRPPGYLIAYDVSQAVSGALGLALGVISRVLQQAAAIQSELDGIF
jgi:Protein of unknown function (DUF2975)